jgi:PPM family protein phosphatase
MSADLTCPKCAEPVGQADRFCEACGKDLLVHRTPAGGPVAATRSRCIACGATEIDSDNYCASCGRAQPGRRDRMEWDLGAVAGVTDRGRHRSRNEDSMAFARIGPPAAARAVVAVVCDGVASSVRADEASQAAADAALDVLAGAALDESDLTAANADAVDAAQAIVTELARDEHPSTAPSSTYVSAVLTSSSVTVGWVGDSRAYWLSAAGSRLLTTDDTVAAQLVAAGMPADEADRVYNAHALSSWIGADAREVRPHVMTMSPAGPGALILCSDGLWNYLPEADDLAAKLPTDAGQVNPLTAATELTALALELGGQDNITVVVVPYPLEEAG